MKLINPFFFLIVASLFFASCENKSNKSSIPASAVYIRLDLTYHSTQLHGPNANAYFTERDATKGIYDVGYGGVLIHASPTSNINNLSGVEYSAFDMACPYEIDENIRIYPDESGAFAVCEKCGSKFELTLGQIATKESLAKENLRRLSISRSGNIINVRQRYNY